MDLAAHLTPPVKIVANLPYNVGTELLIRWLTPAVWPPFWSQLTLMFQKEVAERIVAKPRTDHYGRLALLAQWRCEAADRDDVAAGGLHPGPQGAFRRGPSDRAARAALSLRLQRVAARHCHGLQPAPQDAAVQPEGPGPGYRGELEIVGIPPTARAEEIGLEAFCALARAVKG